MSNINRVIAEMRGWVAEQINGGWRIKSPSGMKWGMIGASSPDEIWEYHGALGNVPDYQHDLNAAIELFFDLPDIAHIVKESWQVSYVTFPGLMMHGIQDNTAPAVAEAICRAWLYWKGIEIE